MIMASVHEVGNCNTQEQGQLYTSCYQTSPESLVYFVVCVKHFMRIVSLGGHVTSRISL